MSAETWKLILDNEVTDVQLNIWLTHLIPYHQFKYPVDWYLRQDERKIKAMYDEYVIKRAKEIVSSY